EVQAQGFANYAVQLWLGDSLNNENPSFKHASIEKTITNNIESSGEENIYYRSKAINSSARKGHVFDSDRNLTGGNLAEFHNNGVKKSEIRHDGAAIIPIVGLTPRTSNISANVNNRGN